MMEDQNRKKEAGAYYPSKEAEVLNDLPGSQMDRLKRVVEKLRAKDGCPWDIAQTHASLKPEVIEEAAEVVCGINILEETGSADNLKEELGDLLLQVIFHAVIAEEEGLFTLEDVARESAEKMIRRHPHVFFRDAKVESGALEAGSAASYDADHLYESWEEIKKREKAGREWEKAYLPAAMEEAAQLLEQAKRRKGFIE